MFVLFNPVQTLWNLKLPCLSSVHWGIIEQHIWTDIADPRWWLYLTIIFLRLSEYCAIIPETKSRGLFDNSIISELKNRE